MHSGAFMAAGPIIFEKKWRRLAWFGSFGLIYCAAIIAIAQWSEARYLFWALLAMVEFVIGWNLPGWSEQNVNQSWEKLKQ